jgi:N-acetylglucosamine-6-phosphate deacetylase
MALDRTKLQRIGGVLPQLHIYDAGADAIATVAGSGYFNAVTDQLRQKDVIIVLGNSNATVDLAVVTSATGAATVTTHTAEGITAT